MKKIIAVLLALITLTVSVFMASCDLTDTTISEVTGEVTKSETTDAPNAEPIPVPVDSINGKNLRQLFEDYLELCENAEKIDMSLTATDIKDNALVTNSIRIKSDGESFYLSVSEGKEKREIWLVDGMIYVNENGEKYKSDEIGLESVLGDGMLNEIFGELPSEMPEAYMKKLETVQLYQLGDEYYATIILTEAEAESMGLSEKFADKETIYFNKNGEMYKSVTEKDTLMTTTVINGINKPLNISKPADASSYVTLDPAGGQNPEIYALYTAIFDKVEDAEIYCFDAIIDGVMTLSYAVDMAGDQYVYAYEGESFYEIWKVAGKTYTAIDGAKPTQTTQDSSEAFEGAKGNKESFASLKVGGAMMKNLQLTSEYGIYEMTFNVNSSGTTINYTIRFNEALNDVEYCMKIGSGNDAQTITYIYYEMGNMYMDIYV